MAVLWRGEEAIGRCEPAHAPRVPVCCWESGGGKGGGRAWLVAGLGPCLQRGGLALDGGGGLWKSCTAVGFKMWLGGSWWFADELGTGHSGRVMDAAGVWLSGWAGTGLWVDGVGKLWFQTEIPSS